MRVIAAYGKRKVLHVLTLKNDSRERPYDTSTVISAVQLMHTYREQKLQDFLDCIIDLREYDVPYHVRFAIDNGKFLCSSSCF